MRILGILDGEIVQAELPLHAQQQFTAGLEQPDPDDVPFLPGPGAGLLYGDVGDAPAFSMGTLIPREAGSVIVTPDLMASARYYRK